MNVLKKKENFLNQEHLSNELLQNAISSKLIEIDFCRSLWEESDHIYFLKIYTRSELAFIDSPF